MIEEKQSSRDFHLAWNCIIKLVSLLPDNTYLSSITCRIDRRHESKHRPRYHSYRVQGIRNILALIGEPRVAISQLRSVSRAVSRAKSSFTLFRAWIRCNPRFYRASSLKFARTDISNARPRVGDIFVVVVVVVIVVVAITSRYEKNSDVTGSLRVLNSS